MGAADDFALVAGSLERSGGSLATAASEMVGREPNRGRALAEHVASLGQAILAHTATRRADFAAAHDPAVQTAAVLELQEQLSVVRSWQATLGWLAAADRPSLDLGSTYFVDALARELVRPTAEVTVVPVDTGSYSTIFNPFDPVISRWGGGLSSSGDDSSVIVVFIPRREQRSGLLHPLIVHELGHAADDEARVVDGLLRTFLSQGQFQDRLREAADQVSSSSKTLSAQDVADHLIRRLQAWTAEAFCDVLAAAALGPTYLYAFVAEVLPTNLDASGPKHPPPRARIRLLLQHLDTFGWTNRMQRIDPAVSDWLASLAQAAAAATYDLEDAFLLSTLSEMSAATRDAAMLRLTDGPFQEKHLDEVAHLLAEGVPAAQLTDGSPTAPAEVILASWVTAIGAEGGGPAGLALAPDTLALSQFLPAALELSVLANAWVGTP